MTRPMICYFVSKNLPHADEGHCLCRHRCGKLCLRWSLWGAQRGSWWEGPRLLRSAHMEAQLPLWPTQYTSKLGLSSQTLEFFKKQLSNLNTIFFLPGEVDDALISNSLLQGSPLSISSFRPHPLKTLILVQSQPPSSSSSSFRPKKVPSGKLIQLDF